MTDFAVPKIESMTLLIGRIASILAVALIIIGLAASILGITGFIGLNCVACSPLIYGSGGNRLGGRRV